MLLKLKNEQKNYYKNIANFETFWWDKNFSKNLLFLKSVYLWKNFMKSKTSKLTFGRWWGHCQICRGHHNQIIVIIMTTMLKMASSRLVAPISATQCCARLRLAFFDILDSDIDIPFLWYWGPWFWTSSLKLGTRSLIIMFMMTGSKWPCHRYLSSSKTTTFFNYNV